VQSEVLEWSAGFTAFWATGLDHYQVRAYSAWYRHITLSMTAAAFLTILRRGAQKGDLQSVPEI
jgi:SRSO17 transposase